MMSEKMVCTANIVLNYARLPEGHKFLTPILPPFVRDLLVCRNEDISAWP